MSRNARTIFLYKFGSEHCGEKPSVSEAPSGPERRRGAPEQGSEGAEMTLRFSRRAERGCL